MRLAPQRVVTGSMRWHMLADRVAGPGYCAVAALRFKVSAAAAATSGSSTPEISQGLRYSRRGKQANRAEIVCIELPMPTVRTAEDHLF